jgi:hypothetical protein
MSNDLIVSEQAQQFMPVMPIAIAVQRRAAIVEFTKQIMVRDTDFGVIPGTGAKPSLLKPGAEKLCSFFGLAPVFVPVETIEDWTGIEHGGEAFFLYRYRCELFRNGNMIGGGIGSCNSWESKYRYRNDKAACPECSAQAIFRSKYPPRHRPNDEPGWYCNQKAGGCGAAFDATDKRITEQPIGKIKNPDPADIVNTVDKMAQKRALIAATLIAVNASEFFTQDVEDMASGYVDATYTVSTSNGNGHSNGNMPPVTVVTAHSDNPFDDEAPATPRIERNVATEKQHKMLFALGKQLYGDNWDTKRPELVKAVTGGRSESAGDLTVKEMSTLLDGLKKRADDKAAIADVTLANVPEMAH